MLYNKNSFLPTLTPTDRTVRIVDVEGFVRYMIKEPDATLSLEGRVLHVVQPGNVDPLYLHFPSPRDARDAMTMLQVELGKLRKNQMPVVIPVAGGGAPSKYFIIPSFDKQTEFNMGFQPKTVDALYVNGQLIDNFAGADYVVENAIFKWLDTAFDLEQDDILLLEYYGVLFGTVPQ